MLSILARVKRRERVLKVFKAERFHMDKTDKINQEQVETEAFELIETAIDDIETLTRAFQVISEVCKELNEKQVSFENCSNQFAYN